MSCAEAGKTSGPKKTPQSGVFFVAVPIKTRKDARFTWQQMRRQQVLLLEQQKRQQQGLEQPQELERLEQQLLLFCRKRTKQQQR